MGEYKFESHERAQLVIDLMNDVEVGDTRHPLHYYVQAAKDFETLEKARSFLQRPCSICMENYPAHDVS